MKTTSLPAFLMPLLAATTLITALVPEAHSAPRHRPGNPRGLADPRGVLDPRGIADPRGVFDPRGPFDPRNPARYMYGLPGGYAMRTYAGVRYYYCSGIYYYPYYINGQTVYTQCPVSNGIPVVPSRPY
jgi:hypothetical protein